jgi:DNA-3-methyladenine glycosylase I
MSGYCLIAPGHPVHDYYHANEYGFPQRDERELFRAAGAGNQPGRAELGDDPEEARGFRAAYDGFDVGVAAYAEQDIERLLSDARASSATG